MISYIYMGLIVLFVVALLVIGFVMDGDDQHDD
jgi:hypothetical protein